MDFKNILNGIDSTVSTIPRVHKRKKKFPNFSEPINLDVPMEKNPFFQNTLVKWEKILGKIPPHNFSLIEHCERLSGGSDEVNHINQDTSTPINELTLNNSITPLEMSQPRDSEASSHNHSRSINEKKVHEIIDCAIQNLQEAGKALASLGQHHEHELKLLMMDALTKFQKWIDTVQKKFEAAKNDVISIRRALDGQTTVLREKDRELAVLQAKLKEYGVNTMQTMENLSNSTKQSQQPSHVITSNVPASISSLSSSSSERISHNVPSGIRHAASPYQVTETAAEHTSPSTPTIISTTPLIQSTADQSIRDVANENVIPTNTSAGPNLTYEKNDEQDLVSNGVLTVPSSLPAETNVNQLVHSVPNSEQINKLQEHTEQSSSAPLSVTDRGVMTNDQVSSDSSHNILNSSQSPPAQNQIPEQDEHRNELESELMQLRHENERMKRNRAEYENAIQRALLQGVSSLNAEALKVLRNPPFICYKPCEPCNQSQSSSPSETMENVPCPAQKVRSNIPNRRRKNPLANVGVIYKPHENGVCSLSSRKQATSVCYTPAKKSSQNSMLFLLPQQHIDCACSTTVQYCVGTNNGRTARTFPRDRVYCTSRITAGRDGFRNGIIRTYSRALEQCKPPCHRNRKFIID